MTTAVQDTDLRALAAEEYDRHSFADPHTCDCGYKPDTGRDWRHHLVGAVLAAVLPVHRAQVLAEAAKAIIDHTDEHFPADGNDVQRRARRILRIAAQVVSPKPTIEQVVEKLVDMGVLRRAGTAPPVGREAPEAQGPPGAVLLLERSWSEQHKTEYGRIVYLGGQANGGEADWLGPCSTPYLDDLEAAFALLAERAVPAETGTVDRNAAARTGYEQAISTLLDVAQRTGSPAARWAADYLIADPDRVAPDRPGRFEALLGAEHEQFDRRGELLRSVVEYADARGLAVSGPGACCDMHNRNCEPPSELCCRDCTEAAHDTFPVRHADGSPCVMSAAAVPGTGDDPPGTPTYDQLLRSHAQLLDQADVWRAELQDLTADRDLLADTIRRYGPVIEAAKILAGFAERSTAPRTAMFERLIRAVAALSAAGTGQPDSKDHDG